MDILKDLPEKLSLVPIEKIPKESVVGKEYFNYPNDLIRLYNVCLQMVSICLKEEGIGLSAFQVGIPWRLFIVRYDKDFRFFIDCNYTPVSKEKEKALEGCLSLRNEKGDFRTFEVERYKSIVVEGHELHTKPFLTVSPVKLEIADVYSKVFQHEIDHFFNCDVNSSMYGKPTLISDIGIEFEVWK